VVALSGPRQNTYTSFSIGALPPCPRLRGG
jgi:hypothetical protein